MANDRKSFSAVGGMDDQPVTSSVRPICTATAASILSAARVYIGSTGEGFEGGRGAVAPSKLTGRDTLAATSGFAAEPAWNESGLRAGAIDAIGEVLSAGLATAAGLTPYALAMFSGSELVEPVMRMINESECTAIKSPNQARGY